VRRVAELGSLGGIARMSRIRKSPPGIHRSVLTIRRFADSFDGLTVKEARKRFTRGKMRMTTWEHGKQLVATYPKHEVRLLFFGNKVHVTSVQVLSK
jgi:hypothetical protein